MDTQPAAPSPRAAQRLRMLARLADLGMALAESAAAGALAKPEPPPEALLAYARISRCVRQTLACEARLEQTPERARDQAIRARAARRRPEIRRQVEQAIADSGSADRENLLIDLEERLYDEDLLLPIATAYIEDVVIDICEQLGLRIDPAQMSDEALDRFIALHDHDDDANGDDAPITTGPPPTGPG